QQKKTRCKADECVRRAGRKVRRSYRPLRNEDQEAPTGYRPRAAGGARPGDLILVSGLTSRLQLETLRRNCAEFGITLHPLGHADQGIAHVIGPQLGLTQPGMTVGCGDSHTATPAPFGALASGSGTRAVERAPATQTPPPPR